jgi:hypothetical protein
MICDATFSVFLITLLAVCNSAVWLEDRGEKLSDWEYHFVWSVLTAEFAPGMLPPAEEADLLTADCGVPPDITLSPVGEVVTTGTTPCERSTAMDVAKDVCACRMVLTTEGIDFPARGSVSKVAISCSFLQFFYSLLYHTGNNRACSS